MVFCVPHDSSSIGGIHWELKSKEKVNQLSEFILYIYILLACLLAFAQPHFEWKRIATKRFSPSIEQRIDDERSERIGAFQGEGFFHVYMFLYVFIYSIQFKVHFSSFVGSSFFSDFWNLIQFNGHCCWLDVDAAQLLAPWDPAHSLYSTSTLFIHIHLCATFC